MAYRAVNNHTGVRFVSNDLRHALQAVLGAHARDDHVATAIDALVSAIDNREALPAAAWAEALNVTVLEI